MWVIYWEGFSVRQIKATLAAVACAGALVACQNPDTGLAVSCRGYASALTLAAQNYDRLDTRERATVQAARDTAGPICSDLDSVSDRQSARASVRAALSELRKVTEKFNASER